MGGGLTNSASRGRHCELKGSGMCMAWRTWMSSIAYWGSSIIPWWGIRGEPSTPDNPAQGLVWRSIVEHLDNGGSQNEFVSVTNVPRETFSKHPWSMGGGGQIELTDFIEQNAVGHLKDTIETICSLC